MKIEENPEPAVAEPIDVFPASFAQQRLWYVDQLEPGNSTYNAPQAFRLSGPLQQAALEQSLRAIVLRHETLRTTFREIDGAPAQIIGALPERPLTVVDLSALAAGEREREAERSVEAEARRPFDLARGPLFRATLFGLNEEENILLLVLHHIVSDGWSTSVLFRELAALYEAFCRGQPPSLPELPIQYADFAVWQREYLEGGVIAAELDYWKKQLAGMPHDLNLPVDLDRPAAVGRRASRKLFLLSKSLSDALKAFSRRGEATLFMTLLAAYYIWLRRTTGQEDLAVGTPVAGRNRAEIEGLIGFFVNTLILRVQLSGHATFRELLASVRKVSLEALTNQNVPYEKLVAIQPRKRARRNALVQTAFSFQIAHAPLQLSGLKAEQILINPGGAKLALTLSMTEDADGLQGFFEYDTALFSDGAIAGMIEDFQNLLAAIVADPERRVSELAPMIAPPKTTGAAKPDIYEQSNLTKNQLLIWLGQKLQPEVPLYNVALTFVVTGAIDPGHFRKALQTLVDSSDALRTVIEEIDGVPQQKVLDRLVYEVEYLDVSADAGAEAGLTQRLERRARVSFDLGARLFDSALIKIAEERFVWYWNQHHIVTDGGSLLLVYRRVSELYGRALEGRLEDRVALPRFQDYVAYQRAQRASPRYAEAEAYWKKRLAEKTDPLSFYGAGRRQRTANVARLSLDLGLERTQKLKALARSEAVFSATEHASVFNVLAAALFAYLYRLHRNPRHSIGVPLHNRTKVFRDTIGLLMEVFPLQIALEENDTFLSVIRKIRSAMAEIRVFRSFTLANSPGDRLYDVLLNYHTAQFPPFHGMPMRQEWLHTGYENDALALQVRDFENTGSFVMDFDFHQDVFDEAERPRAARHFLGMLETLLENPARSLQSLSLLAPEERRHILVDLNRSTGEPRGAQVLPRLFEAQARKTPDGAALRIGDEALTYAGLNARANRLARHLRALGVGAEIVVGVCAEPSPALLVGILGILKAGGAYLPLDPEYPAERLSFMLRDAGARVVVTERRWLESFPALAAVLSGPTVVDLDSDAGIIARYTGENFDPGTTPGHLAYVIYTSGSTGTPKGVMIEHGAICNRLQWGVEFYGLSPSDRVLQKSTFAFDASVWEIFEPLLAGAEIVMASAGARRDLAALAGLIVKERVTVAEFAPSILRALLEEGSIAGGRSLKRIFSGGEALTVELEKKFFATLDAELYNTYGPTEASVDVAHWKCGAVGDRHSVPIGRPIAGMKIYILDPRLEPVPLGAPGELVIGGAGIARGYLNHAELTAEKFPGDPFGDDPGARLYRTGDLARHRPDGAIEFLGRFDQQVKIRGFRIEPGEIEAVLSRHPAVGASAVIAREDSPGGARLVAYVVPARGRAAAASDLREFLKEKLPDYMTPATIVFLDAMPLTANHKIDRAALPPPEQIGPDLREDFVAPEGPIETALARIWGEVLKVERIGARDNFFELGGDSILSIHIVAKANQAGIRITPKDIFQHQTIAELAAARGTAPAVHAEQGAVIGPAPLTPIQRAFFELELVEPHHWNMAMLLEAAEPVSPNGLRRAVEELLSHHDALRLRFVREASGWRQRVVVPDDQAPCARVDLSALSDAEQDRAIEETGARVQASLSLAEGPLLRVCLFDLGPLKPGRLLFVVHHLAIDAVSWRILLEDFETAYRGASGGAPARLPAKTTSFKHWAERLAEHARSDALRQEAEYWLAALRGEAAPLPRDHPAGINNVASSRSVSVSLAEEETQALLQSVPEAYHARIDEILLTALAQTLARWTESGSLLVDVEGHGREDIVAGVDLSRTVGWFTTVYPVRLELPEPADRAGALKSVKENLRRIPNRGIGYGLLRYLCGDAALAEKIRALPRAEASFNYFGRFGEMSSGSLLARASESAGPTRSPAGQRSYLLEINGRVAQGRLRMTWTYSEYIHRRDTIENLAASFIEFLRSLIDRRGSLEAGYTPSDFPDVELTQAELDEILARLEKSAK